MILELNAANGLLEEALDRYSGTLSAVPDLCGSGSQSQTIQPAISSEFAAIATYETKLNRAEVLASRKRNSDRSFVPISALPPDILTHIFKLLVDSQPPCSAIDREKYTPPVNLRHPDVLTRVCSRWRRIAIDSCSLWTSIALAPLDPPPSAARPARNLRVHAKMIISRATLFLSRAGQSKLNIYLHGGELPLKETNTEFDLFWAGAIPQTRCLEFVSTISGHLDFLVFRNYMALSTPGTLQQLAILGGSRMPDDPSHFIHGGGASLDPTRWQLDVPEEILEDVLRPISVLRLRGRYFRWESQAYSGLVELRLVIGTVYSETRVPVTTAHIAQILVASPKLRILHFGILIEDSRSTHQPVPLHDLEILNLRSMPDVPRDLVLQLIAPGRKDLQLLVCLPRTEDPSMPLLSHEILEFFSRSNIAELRLSQDDKHPRSLSDVLSALPLPRLRALSLHLFKLDHGHSPPADRLYPSTATFVSSQLEILQFSHCTIDMDDLRWATVVFPISQIQDFKCPLVSTEIGETHEYKDAQNELTKTFPKLYLRPETYVDFCRRWDNWPFVQ